ncbi:hypothetical protein GGH96_005607 [Coemansia sp. RSA 1972]|nr:hypothetical protein GGH96_005607 [Coemansia sp. RSA 1972]
MDSQHITLDSLPYIDKEYDDPATREHVLSLVQEEMAQMSPPLMPKDTPIFKTNDTLRKEYERVRSGHSLPPFSTDRYNISAPTSDTASVQEWEAASNNAASQLEHQTTRIDNLELLQNFGAQAWKLSNHQKEQLLSSIENKTQKLREEGVHVNKARKYEQTEAGVKLRELEERWSDGAEPQLPSARQYTIGVDQAGQKLRPFLIHTFHNVLVRADTIALLRQKRVRVNGQFVLDTHLLQLDDCVQVDIDALHSIKSRLRGLQVEVKYTEPGLIVLSKAPGINKRTVEWAAAAIEVSKDTFEGVVPECDALVPWIAVNEVEKGMGMLVILVNNSERHMAMLEHVDKGRVRFTICAVCHGKVDDSVFVQTSMTDLAKQTHELTIDDTSPDHGLWFKYNHLRPDIFSFISANVTSVTQSSTVGNLSLVQASILYTTSPSLVLRRFMFELEHPIAGSQNHTRPLINHKDKGTLQAFVCAEFPSLATNNVVTVSEDVPPKLLNVCAREAKFFDRRKEQARVEMEKLSASDLDLGDCVPAAYASGRKEFCGFVFHVTCDTLIPRPSTETLVNTTVEFVNKRNDCKADTKIMDLGTGSGCILLSVLLRTTNTRGIGIDISTLALSVAHSNNNHHKLSHRAEFVPSSFETFTRDPNVVSRGPFDFIACNPPYVSATKASRMRAMMENEPMLALVADNGGYQAYRDIHTALASASVLARNGCIAFEIGKGMENGVRSIFGDWIEVDAMRDTQGVLRVLVFQQVTQETS